MTAETLKPFIPAPRCIDNSSSMHSSPKARCKRRFNLYAIICSVLALSLTLVLLGFTIWQFQHISRLETDLKHLDKVILSMQNRLDLKNLDEMDDYGKEYNHKFIDDQTLPVNGDDTDAFIVQENDEDMDEDDTEFDYEEFKKKLIAMNYDGDIDDENEDGSDFLNVNEDDIIDNTFVRNGSGYEDESEQSDDDEDVNQSDGGDLYNDFSKFNATRKKMTNPRKSRSIPGEDAVKDYEKSEKTNAQNNRSKIDQTKSNSERKMLMLRLSPELSEKTDPKIELKTSAKEYSERKRLHRHHIDSRKHKTGTVKKAKNRLQTETKTNKPAAHFHLNRRIPDRYSSIRIDSYSGDMYIGHPSWSNEIDVDNYFKVENGLLTVHESGLYYVYAQVCYNNTHDQNGFVIFHGHKPFLQCLNTVPTNIPHKIHTCHTSGLIFLKDNETIHLRDFHSDRNAILKEANNRSYFGLIKI